MFKIFKTLIFLVWLVDIFDMNIVINGSQILNASMLDVGIPINFWFWLLFWLLVPSSTNRDIEKLTTKIIERLDD